MSRGTAPLFLVTGPTSAGKTTLVRTLCRRRAIRRIVPCTTRQRRDDERDGVDYRFVSKSWFEKHVRSDSFIEWEKRYGGHYYGALRSEVLHDVPQIGIVSPSAVRRYRNTVSRPLHVILVTAPHECLRRRLRDAGDERSNRTSGLSVEMAAGADVAADVTIENVLLDSAVDALDQFVGRRLREDRRA